MKPFGKGETGLAFRPWRIPGWLTNGHSTLRCSDHSIVLRSVSALLQTHTSASPGQSSCTQVQSYSLWRIRVSVCRWPYHWLPSAMA